MALRIPSVNPDRAAHELSTCEVILDTIRQRCGPVVTGEALHELWDGDRALVRYSRDTLGLFASLGQVEHVRRDLWILDPVACTDHEREWLRAAAAGRSLGAWAVVSGAWALVLHRVLRSMPDGGLRFLLTPRPARLGTHSRRGCDRRDDLDDVLDPSIQQRHVSVVLGARVTAIRRPYERLGEAGWQTHEQLEAGVHVATPADALVSMCEHPRASGGMEVVRAAVLPVLAAVGVSAVVERGAAHGCIAVRRRLAWLLRDAASRCDGSIVVLGELVDDFDERWWWRDEEELWRIDAALDTPYGGRRTVLEPHLLPLGRRRDPWIIDNRGAPPLRATRGPDGLSLRRQMERARAERVHPPGEAGWER